MYFTIYSNFSIYTIFYIKCTYLKNKFEHVSMRENRDYDVQVGYTKNFWKSSYYGPFNFNVIPLYLKQKLILYY